MAKTRNTKLPQTNTESAAIQQRINDDSMNSGGSGGHPNYNSQTRHTIGVNKTLSHNPKNLEILSQKTIQSTYKPNPGSNS